MLRIAIIPARGGSTRIPRKNIKLFHGRPILEYSVMVARATRLFTSGIWVSTEDREIARVAADLGVYVHHRSPAFARDEVGTQEVMRNALDEIDPVGVIEAACCIYPCAPLMRMTDLMTGYGLLTTRVGAIYVHSVGPDGVDAGQWYWGRAKAFVYSTPLTKAYPYVLPAERTCDINTPEDWARAEHLYAQMILHKEAGQR